MQSLNEAFEFRGNSSYPRRLIFVAIFHTEMAELWLLPHTWTGEPEY
jgi:hypothetical protein